MIQVIDGKRYNTEKAELIYSDSNEKPDTDICYRHRNLYLTGSGKWFIHNKGGALSNMAVTANGLTFGSERIEPIEESDAFDFLQVFSFNPKALNAVEKYFAAKIVDA